MRTTRKYLLGILVLFLLALPDRLAADETGPGSDTWKTAALSTVYTLNPFLNSFELSVDVADDTAVLNGTVESQAERDLAEQLALAIDGIEKVENRIVVNEDISRKRPIPNLASIITEASTQAAVKSKLLWNRNTSDLDIEVTSIGKTVTLRGTVATEQEKQAVGVLALNTPGVVSVKNELKTDSKKIIKRAAQDAQVDDHWITTKVKATLLFSAEALGSDLSVSTKQGVVTLEGTAKSAKQKQEIISLIAAVKGVKQVNDKIRID